MLGVGEEVDHAPDVGGVQEGDRVLDREGDVVEEGAEHVRGVGAAVHTSTRSVGREPEVASQQHP
ncbi:hypothetical protein GCM10027067_34670 [Pseudactinotalea suaedae]